MHTEGQSQRHYGGSSDGRPLRPSSPAAPVGARTVAVTEFAAAGVRVELLQDAQLHYLLVTSRVESAQSMLLRTGAGLPPRGLSAYSRLGRWYALYWSLVWGWGAPPAHGVLFTTDDLRFRREARVPAPTLGGGWLAVCEGAFSLAACADGSAGETWLDLAPQW